MFLTEIKTLPLNTNANLRSFNAETVKPCIHAYEILEDITSIIACQEKSYAFPVPIAVTAIKGVIPLPFWQQFQIW